MSGTQATEVVRLGVIGRTIAAFVCLGAFLIAAVVGTLWQVAQQRADGMVVNLAGRQRMLSQRLVAAALSELQEGGGTAALRASSGEFQEALDALSRGDAAKGVPPPTPEVYVLVDAARGAWEPFKADLERVALEAPEEQALRRALNGIADGNQGVLAAAQALVEAARARGDAAAAVDAIGALRMHSQRVARLAFEVERGAGAAHARELEESVADVDRTLAEVNPRTAAGDLAAPLDALRRAWLPLRAHATVVASQAGRRHAILQVAARLRPAGERVLTTSEAVVQRLADDAQKRVADLVTLLWGLLAAGVALTAVFSWMARAGLVPLSDLERVAARISQGDLRQEVAIRRQDEIGRLAGAFKAMVVELRSYTGRAGEVAQALGAATAEINASVQEQTATVTSQAAAVAQATSSLAELKANAVRNDGRARDVLTTAKATIQGMKQVQDQVAQIASSIVALSEKTQQIGEILDSVSDIADQSNLLALNASIEASKAGEFGRGFEVVAAEVRSLAQQSQKATLSIRGMLRDIQRAMNAAVMGTEEGTKRVEKQSTDLDTATQAVEQIVYATREQTQAIEQIADAVTSVSGSISESQASSTQIAEASRGLVTQAEALRGVLARFSA